VSALARRLRSLLIALTVLALSATIALAARPTTTPPDHSAAAQRDKTHAGATENPTSEESEEAEESDELEAPEGDESESPDVDEAEAPIGEVTHPDNHGKLVSEAAQAETPDGFDNHGAAVRVVARDNHGHATAETKVKAPKKSKNH
jgi:hypothetical protein